MKEAQSSSETSVITRALRGITSQKTPFFIVTAVNISNLTKNKTIREKGKGNNDEKERK
jgi:hypothetical protein